MKGHDVELEPTSEPRQAEVVDLMERLRRSLAQSGGAKAGGAVKSSRPRKARATAKRTSGRKRAKTAA
jgi:non-homologous end joining protein Ku